MGGECAPRREASVVADSYHQRTRVGWYLQGVNFNKNSTTGRHSRRDPREPGAHGGLLREEWRIAYWVAMPNSRRPTQVSPPLAVICTVTYEPVSGVLSGYQVRPTAFVMLVAET